MTDLFCVVESFCIYSVPSWLSIAILSVVGLVLGVLILYLLIELIRKA